mgnify:CR=1 FL=1
MCSFCGKSHAEVRKLIARARRLHLRLGCITVYAKGSSTKELSDEANRKQSTSIRVPKPAGNRA